MFGSFTVNAKETGLCSDMSPVLNQSNYRILVGLACPARGWTPEDPDTGK